MQHATVFDVFNLDRGIDAALERDFFHGPSAIVMVQGTSCSGSMVSRPEIETVSSPSGQGTCGCPPCEFKRDHAHAHKVGAVDTLEAFCDHGFDTQKRCAFGRPVA